MDGLAKANGVRWYRHELRRNDDGDLRLALRLEVQARMTKKDLKKQMEETEMIGLKTKDAL